MSERDDAAFQALVSTAVDGIVVMDAQGHIRIFNPACEHLFGYPEEEVIGESLTVLIPSHRRGIKDGQLAQVSRETLGRRKDGSSFPIALSVGQGKMEDGDITVGIIHDLSQRGAAALLDVARLSAMGQMGSALAHEINQPLAAVMNYVKAAQRTLEPSQDVRAVKATELLVKAAEQVVRAGTIIRGLRDFIGKRAVIRREEKLDRIVEEAVALGLSCAAGSNLKATVVLDPHLPPVLVDRVQIQQVIIDLIRNAVEAMQTVRDRHLNIESSLAEGRRAQVTISDTGSGFSEGVFDRMFQPFVTTKAEGMGLGLTICQSIINAHGGRLWATPNAGPGASFHFQLPLAEKTED